MRCLLFVVVAMFLVAGSQGLTACSGGGGEEAKPASTKAVSSADLSWDDVPVFPRARALKSDTKMFDETVKRAHTAKGEIATGSPVRPPTR